MSRPLDPATCGVCVLEAAEEQVFPTYQVLRQLTATVSETPQLSEDQGQQTRVRGKDPGKD